MKTLLKLLIILSFMAGGPALALQSDAETTPHVTARLIADQTAITPGGKINVALHLKIIPGWHTYWQNPGDSGLPTEIEWGLPQGTQVSQIQWPAPKVIEEAGNLTIFGYHDDVYLISSLAIPESYTASSVPIETKVNWLVCEEICIPENVSLKMNIPVQQDPLASSFEETFKLVRQQIPTPVDWRASFYEDGTTLNLLIERPLDLEPISDKPQYFYPITEELVNYSPSQTKGTTPDGIKLTQQKSDYFNNNTKDFTIVVKEGNSFYELTASKKRNNTIVLTTPSTASSPVSVPNLPLGQALLFAFIGGLILNLMPCVFPILSIKILSYCNKAGKQTRHIREEGLVFTAGVIVSFLVIAGLLIALRSGGEALGWGFQLQSPGFVSALIYILFFLGLSLSGLVMFGTSLMGIGSHLTQKKGHAGAFFTGVLATIVATPCTAPFMGPAMGYALTQPAAISTLVFAVLGLGMAFPYLLLTWFPHLLKYLPKPGAWMDVFKQFMAFPIYLTVVWLLWVLNQQVDSFGLGLVLLGLVLIAFASWIASITKKRKLLSKLMVLVCAVLVIATIPMLSNSRPATTSPAIESHVQTGDYITFNPDTLETLLAENKPVFTNMTAAWCITCLANERIALNTEDVKTRMEQKGITYMKGDWTNYDAQITKYLESFGRNGVPLYVYYPVQGEPVVLPQLLTKSLVLETLK